jgi:hypothetical protein
MPLALPFFFENARDLEIIGAVLGAIFWIQMIRYCLMYEREPVQKIVWVIFMLMVPGLGALIYFFARVTRLRRL